MRKRNWKKWLAALLCTAICMGNVGVCTVSASVLDGGMEETQAGTAEEETVENLEEEQETPKEEEDETENPEEEQETPKEEEDETENPEEEQETSEEEEDETENPEEEQGTPEEEEGGMEDPDEEDLEDTGEEDTGTLEEETGLEDVGEGVEKTEELAVLQEEAFVSAYNSSVYSARAASPNWYCGAYTSRNPFASSNLYGQCTWYAWGRAYEVTGKTLPCRGDGGTWYGVAQGYGWDVGSEPRANSIAVWSGGNYGHVAYVESVNGNSVIISESNVNPSTDQYIYSLEEGIRYYYGQHSFTFEEMKNRFGLALLGYIYLEDNAVPTGSYMETGYAQTLRNGQYHIVTALDENMGLHIERGSYEDEANVWLWEGAENDGVVFTLTYSDSGFYTISRGGKCLDVSGADMKRGANVWMYQSNGGGAQQWALKAAGDGTYTLQARCNGFYLDVSGGGQGMGNGTNIQVWEEVDYAAQKWRFIPCGNAIGQTIPDGEYQIALYRDKNKTLGAENNQTAEGTNVWLNSYGNDRRNTFDIKYLGSGGDGHGQYSITSHSSGLSLDVDNGGWSAGTNVKLWTYNGANPQRWMIKENPDGGYNIISRLNGMYVDVDGGVTADGTNVQVWEGNDTFAQSWVFIPWDTKPSITVSPSASEITYGQTLSDSMLSGGAAGVSGSFAWKDGSIRPTCADSGKTVYTVVFTPDDMEWESIELDITVKVNPAQNPPGMPGTVMNVSHDKQRVGDIPLSPGWAWDEADKEKALNSNVGVNAVAVYIGSDKGNYVNESVTISITKSACSHPEAKRETRNASDAGCETDGYSGDIYCTECNSVIESGHRTAKLGHHYVGIITKEPTQEEAGEKTYTCSRCQKSYTEMIPKLPKEDEGDSHSHSYSNSVTLEPSCDAVGERTYICSCGRSYIEMIPSLGHDYTVEITKEPTEEEYGERIYTCSRCHKSYTDSIPKIEQTHVHSYGNSVTLEPTCEEDGERTYICFCGDNYIEIIPSLGHDYDMTVTREPTKDKEGEKRYTCRRCKNTYTETIPKGGESGDWGDSTGTIMDADSTDSTGTPQTSEHFAAVAYGSDGRIAELETWKPRTPDEKKRYACLGREAVRYTLAKDNAYRIVIENAMQGPMCFDSFEAVLDNYTIGRTYNVYTLPNIAYSMETEIQFTLTIPAAIYEKDRTYRMICVTKNGLPIVCQDLDNDPETITVRTNKFYAYALVYK